jgi:DNA end-binding protein Ku
MASRSVWKGFIRFSLVSIPVKAYTAKESGGGGIALNQLHVKCNSRINYKKTCPVHGEIPNSEIVSGYEFADGQYVVVDPADIEKLRTPSEKSLTISGFIKPQQIDARYFTGTNYYLLPDGPIGEKPYALLRKVLIDCGRYGFAQVSLRGKDNIVIIRPVGEVLGMSVLAYDEEMKKLSEFDQEVPKVQVTPAEAKIAKMLVDELSEDEFDLTQYRDQYTEKLKQLIELKIAGKEVVEPPPEEAPRIGNLMEALEKSLAAAKQSRTRKPAKLTAPGTAAKAAGAARKRKTS